MPELKESIIKAYDSVMSKLGVESFVIQWNHAYKTPKDCERHFHVVLTQSIMPIKHDKSEMDNAKEGEMKIEFLPFPFRKFIIVNPEHHPHSKEYEDYTNRHYTKKLIP